MSGYDEITVDQLRRRGGTKWSRYGGDVLPLWIAEMDYPMAPAIRLALQEALDRSYVGYPPSDDQTGLPDALSGWLWRERAFKVDPTRVRILPDVLQGILLAIQYFSPSASPVVITTPSYPPFFEVVRAAGRPIVEVAMLDDDGAYKLDLEGIDRALADGAGTVVLCNPYNPLGRVFTKGELLALASVVESRNARVVADEIHMPLVYSGSIFTPYSTISEQAARHSITITAATKGWSLPGLKCAEAILTNEDDVEIWDNISPVFTHGASTFGITASVAAFTEGTQWLNETLQYLDHNRRYLGDLLSDLLPQVRYRVPQATHLAWLDCRDLKLDNPMEFFLEHAKVALNDGHTFGAPGSGFVRFNFATSRAIMEQAVQAMSVAYKTFA